MKTLIYCVIIATSLLGCSRQDPLSTVEPSPASKLVVSATKAGGRPYKASPARTYFADAIESDLTISDDLSPDFFPLQVGNYWEFKVYSTFGSKAPFLDGPPYESSITHTALRDWGLRRVEVVDEIVVNDTTYFQIDGHWSNLTDPMLLRREGLRFFSRHLERDQLVYDFSATKRKDRFIADDDYDFGGFYGIREFGYVAATHDIAPSWVIRPRWVERHFRFLTTAIDTYEWSDSYAVGIGPFYYDSQCFCAPFGNYGFLVRAKIGNRIIEDANIFDGQLVVDQDKFIVHFSNAIAESRGRLELSDGIHQLFAREAILAGSLTTGFTSIDSLNAGNILLSIEEQIPWQEYLFTFSPDIDLSTLSAEYHRLNYIDRVSLYNVQNGFYNPNSGFFDFPDSFDSGNWNLSF